MMTDMKPGEAQFVKATNSAQATINMSDWVPGMAPDDGVLSKDPPCGDDGHHCRDLKGRYRPDWTQVLIEHTPESGGSVYCPDDIGDGWHVRTGEWVDCPPAVLRTLLNCQFEISYVPTMGSSLRNQSHSHDTRPMRRFHFQIKPSA